RVISAGAWLWRSLAAASGSALLVLNSPAGSCGQSRLRLNLPSLLLRFPAFLQNRKSLRRTIRPSLDPPHHRGHLSLRIFRKYQPSADDREKEIRLRFRVDVKHSPPGLRF